MRPQVLAIGADPTTTTVGEAMTRGPRCVNASDAAVDALVLMVENRFRHLPVSAPGDGLGRRRPVLAAHTMR